MMAQFHTSAAAKQLRSWITLLSIVVAGCAVTQMLVYGFVNYTEVRFTEAAKPSPLGERKLEVTSVEPSEAVVATDTAPAVVGGVRAKAIASGKTVAPARIKSSFDAVLARTSETTAAIGTVGCICMAVLTLIGVVIAGGANVPGVERAVTAGVWALVLGLLCLPWRSAFPGLMVPGIFGGYEAMTAAADKAPGAVGGTAAFGQWLVMPLVGAVLSLFVCGWFRAGVERGIMASVNPADLAIQREMQAVAKRGVVVGATRSGGALSRVVGPSAAISPSAAPMVPIAPVVDDLGMNAGHGGIEQAVDEAAAMAASLVREAGGGRSVADLAHRRLI